MRGKFKQLYEEISGEPQISYERFQQATQELLALGDISDDLLAALEEQFLQKNWGVVFRLIAVIHYLPNTKFTPILCEILDNHKEQGIAENVVDALDIINDEYSIPALTRSLEYFEPGDDDRQLNRKIIYALSKLGNAEAIDAIKLAQNSSDMIIRGTARTELERICK